MYESYLHSNMKPKPDMYGAYSRYVHQPSSAVHDFWNGKSAISGWQQIAERYADSVQETILCATAISGVSGYQFSRLFDDLYLGNGSFKSIHLDWLTQQAAPTLDALIQNITTQSWYYPHYPIHCPLLLTTYGYGQSDYLQDLDTYWENIDQAYYAAWDTMRIGVDSPAVAEMRRVSQTALNEMSRLGVAANQMLTVQDDEFYDYDEEDFEQVIQDGLTGEQVLALLQNGLDPNLLQYVLDQ